MEIVNPGGTGKPNYPISDRFAPFPPKNFFGYLSFLEFFNLKLKTNLLTINFLYMKNLDNFHKFCVAFVAILNDSF